MTSRASLLGLPVELRVEIYRNLLSCRTKHHTALGYTSLKLQPTILRTNLQIYHEASNVWRQNVFVLFTTSWTRFEAAVLHSGGVPRIAEQKAANKCQTYHMRVFLDHTPETYETCYTCIIRAEDLNLICRSLICR